MLDEIHKVPGWSEQVKLQWDRDSASRTPLRVILLASAPLLVQKGLTESLAGRFELVRVPHWSLSEMERAFGWTLDEYLYFGGYPGAAGLVRDQPRWSRYVGDSLVETTISRDVLQLSRVDKPALLHQLFRLGCDHSGQILSYQKMLGQLQGAGNTTTLAHYLELLSGAGMLCGLQKYAGSRIRRRGSSPKLLALNTALITTAAGLTFDEARADRTFWGRLVESAVGAHLVNELSGSGIDVLYWRERGMEVDYVLARARRVMAIEVTSSRRKDSLRGMGAFTTEFHPLRALLVGGQGVPLRNFLRRPASAWLGDGPTPVAHRPRV